MSINKREEELINNLLSNKLPLVIETLEEIKYAGNSKLLPFLIDLFHVSKNGEIKKHINGILSELKHSDAVPIIIEAILNEKYSDEQEMLVRSCWENSLDFTSYISVFIDLAIHGNYMTSFEAFTVIENLEGTISDEETKKSLSLLQDGLSCALNERKVLILELIQFIPKLAVG
jgi:hypothetical protein